VGKPNINYPKHEGGKVGVITADGRPTLAECEDAMQRVEAHGGHTVRWYYEGAKPDDYRTHWAKRCECGSVARNDSVCALCRALAPLVIGGMDDVQYRYEQAERAFERIGRLLDKLSEDVRRPSDAARRSP
jgi:hypothetical protein